MGLCRGARAELLKREDVRFPCLFIEAVGVRYHQEARRRPKKGESGAFVSIRSQERVLLTELREKKNVPVESTDDCLKNRQL